MKYTLRGKVARSHPYSLDKTLTVEGTAAESKSTGEAIEKVRKTLSDLFKAHSESTKNPHKVTKEQLVSSNAVKKSSTLIVGAHPDNTSIYSECQIMCSSQEDGSLIFSCIETPTVDVMANVIILD